ncbi:hypothetical protein HWV62_20662 [Athelia sp. TMB]|nr:hypothetical protein HWV62_20662 [Athelia sp. TMB]
MPRAISTLIGTNLVPTPEEALEISRIVSEKQLAQQRLQSEIQKAQEALEKLSQDQCELQAIVETHRNLLAPFRRICPEILGEIFLQCLPGDHEPSSPFHLHSPIVLTRVSRLWRAVALTTPRLWAEITDYVSQRRAPVCGGEVDNTSETWLRLSRSCPLYITLHDKGTLGIPLQRDWESVAATFLEHSTRWKTLTITHPDTSLSLFRADDMQTLSLEAVDITATSWKSHDDTAMGRLAGALHSSPRLRKFSWRTGWLDFHESLLAIPWNQLTHVELDCRISLDSFTKISSQLTNVEHCSLHRVWGERSQLAPAPPAILPHMKVFELSCAMSITSLLSAVVLPAITELKIDHFAAAMGAHAPSWSQPAFDALFTGSSCNLRRLFLDVQTPISELEILACLQLASNTLVELYIGGTVKVDDQVLSALTAQKTGPAAAFICPKLEILDLRRCLCSSDGALADMVASRWKEDREWEGHSADFPGLSRLSLLTLMIYSRRTSVLHMGSLKTDHDDDLERLNEMRLKGLCGQITHYVS